MTEFRFNGEWGAWSGLGLALALAALAWLIYRRELRGRTGALRWWLPTLRALAVWLVVMMLAGPVLNHRWTVGEVARLLVFVDGSKSMSLHDDQMGVDRKVQIARQLGWISEDWFDRNLQEARLELDQARAKIEGLKPEGSSLEFHQGVRDLAERIGTVLGLLQKVGAAAWPAARAQSVRFAAEVGDPAARVAGQLAGNDPRRLHREMMTLLNVVARWEQTLRDAWRAHATEIARQRAAELQPVFAKLDQSTRWQRLEAGLLAGESGLARKLAARHEVELLVLEESLAKEFWQGSPEAREAQVVVPPALPGGATNAITDLNIPVREKVLAAPDSRRTAVLLFTDGHHNRGGSPLESARLYGQRGVAVYAVGIGTDQRPTDLAVLEIRAPETVAPEGNLRGEIVLKDDVPQGVPFNLRVEHEGVVLWQTNLHTRREGVREVAFDFPLKQAAARMTAGNPQLRFASLPLRLQARAGAVEGEKDTGNNEAAFQVAMVNRKPKVLLLDGRPRWEFRYLRNLFERDERWEVHALLAGLGGEYRPWTRGRQPGQFPDDKETLYSFDLIVFGDVPVKQFRPVELEWLRDFVEKRGGGVVFMDGQRERLLSYGNSALKPLFPVAWPAGIRFIEDPTLKFHLVALGELISPLNLAGDNALNAGVWSGLPGPHWTTPVEALPGAEVLVELHGRAGRVPALVFRRYGAGKVLYAGFDETWRWRYQVGDLYHLRFWHQVAGWIMEPPFQVMDRLVALDSGKLQYRPGDVAEIRVRLLEATLARVRAPKVEAHLYQKGKRVALLALQPDAGSTGIFRGRTAALTEGEFEVRVHVEGIPEQEILVRSSFIVGSQSRVEMAQLHCHEELLRQVAGESGGRYFREEEMDQLLRRLEPLSQGRVLEEQTSLWNSYWWFVPIMLLLAVEWALRKRAGLL